MKILVNGQTTSEIIKSKLNNRYSQSDLDLVEMMIEHIKTNKVMYAKLVFTTALMIHFNSNSYASAFSDSVDSIGYQLVDMFLVVAKWSCIGMGLNKMITTVITGGNMKHATIEGGQYFLGYLFIQFFPQLFELFTGIKF